MMVVQVAAPHVRGNGNQYYQHGTQGTTMLLTRTNQGRGLNISTRRGANMMQARDTRSGVNISSSVRRGFSAAQTRLGTMYRSKRGNDVGRIGKCNLEINQFYELYQDESPMILEEDGRAQGVQFIQDRRNNRYEDELQLYDRIILDSGATDNTFCNPEFLRDIRESQTPLHMMTNAGSRMIYEEGQCDNLNMDAYYDPD